MLGSERALCCECTALVAFALAIAAIFAGITAMEGAWRDVVGPATRPELQRLLPCDVLTSLEECDAGRRPRVPRGAPMHVFALGGGDVWGRAPVDLCVTTEVDALLDADIGTCHSSSAGLVVAGFSAALTLMALAGMAAAR